MIRMSTHAPEEFVSKLSANQLPDPNSFSVAGMLKVSEESPSIVNFTMHRNCERWLPLPLDIVQTFTHIANVTCKDHEHPLVKVKFKNVEETQRGSAFLMSLCSQLQSSLTHAHRANRSRRSSKQCNGEEFRQDCYVVDVGGSLEVCCWYDGVIDCTGMV